MKLSILALIFLLVLTNGLLINRQARMHSLQATINTQQQTITEQKNIIESYKEKLHTPGTTSTASNKLDKQTAFYKSEMERYESMYKYDMLIIPDLQKTNKALIEDWQKALPQLKQFHQEHPEQPLPYDVNDGRY